MSEDTLHEQVLWERYNAIEAENYHLKRQLTNKNNEIRSLKNEIKLWRNKYKGVIKNKKLRYRNNGKAGK